MKINSLKYFTTAAGALVFFLFFSSHAHSDSFEADSALAKRAEKKAEELTQLVEAQFQIKLDYSEDSIEQLDTVIDQIHGMFIQEQPDDAQLLPLAQGFGSYIGEVYRRHHDATWGWITQGTEVFPGLQQAKGGTFWPWTKALDRIKTNNEPTISDYYHFLVIR